MHGSDVDPELTTICGKHPYQPIDNSRVTIWASWATQCMACCGLLQLSLLGVYSGLKLTTALHAHLTDLSELHVFQFVPRRQILVCSRAPQTIISNNQGNCR